MLKIVNIALNSWCWIRIQFLKDCGFTWSKFPDPGPKLTIASVFVNFILQFNLTVVIFRNTAYSSVTVLVDKMFISLYLSLCLSFCLIPPFYLSPSFSVYLFVSVHPFLFHLNVFTGCSIIILVCLLLLASLEWTVCPC